LLLWLVPVTILAGLAALPSAGWPEAPTERPPTRLLRFAQAESALSADPKRAAAECRLLLAECPGYPGVRLLLAEALLAAGDWRGAEQPLREVVADEPDDWAARYLLGRLLIENRGRRIDDPEASELLLASVERDTGRGLPPAAEFLQKRLPARRETADLRCRLGEALLAQGQYHVAVLEFHQVLRATDHTHARAKAGLAKALRALAPSR
jgi:Flp pilus assembly protein TadD